jgi:hypothetical protein
MTQSGHWWPFRYDGFCQYDYLSLAGGGNEAAQ